MSKKQGYDTFIKLVLVGDAGVGKTSLMNRIVSDEFKTSYIPTIAADLKSKIIYVQERRIKLDVWDTAGQEKFRSLCSIHYKGADIIALVFDLNSMKTLDSLIEDWIDEIAIYCNSKSTKLLILGNKADTPNNSIDEETVHEKLKSITRCKLVRLNHIDALSKTNDMSTDEGFKYIYASVSAKTGHNIDYPLNTLLDLIVMEHKTKKQITKRERDFGETKIVINENDLSTRIRKKACC